MQTTVIVWDVNTIAGLTAAVVAICGAIVSIIHAIKAGNAAGPPGKGGPDSN